MTTNKVIPYSELRQFLATVGFSETKSPSASIFHHPKEGLLVFRLYRDEESVDPRDLANTRKFLDWRGLFSGAEFDLFLQQVPTSA
jgi:hypothetical protein